jgi:polysaccharide biosynthesis/export protein
MGRKTKLVLAIFMVFFAATVTPLVFANQKDDPNSAASGKIQNALEHGADNLPASVTNSTSDTPQLQRRYPRYQIDSGDILEIDFPYTPDFNQTVTVNPDGYISLRNAGGIHIAGETVPQVKKDIRDAYSKILRDPEVSITLKQFQNPYFLALGQVNKPGKYDLRGATTVAQAVAMAGGFTSNGKRNDIILFRRVSDNWVSATKVNLKHMLTSKNLSEDLQMHPGDMIFVPQNRLSKIKPFIKLPSLSYYF